MFLAFHQESLTHIRTLTLHTNCVTFISINVSLTLDEEFKCRAWFTFEALDLDVAFLRFTNSLADAQT